jgi:hypothetical protein
VCQRQLFAERFLPPQQQNQIAARLHSLGAVFRLALIRKSFLHLC